MNVVHNVTINLRLAVVTNYSAEVWCSVGQ